MSWLIVAKMPLLISSRMTSATLTDSSSASSLTVIVPGSSIAPRSRGSIVWTGDAFWSVDAVACGARAGRGCRSYSLPRAPPWAVCVVDGSDTGLREERRWELGLERPAQGALGDGDG